MDLKTRTKVLVLPWEIKGKYMAYNSTLKKCNLCVNEKLAIVDYPEKNLLNKTLKKFSQCHHRNKLKLVSLRSRETPNEVTQSVIPLYCIVALRYSVIITRLKIVA